MPRSRTILTILTALSVYATPAHAQSLLTSLEEMLASDDAGLRLLRDNGAKFNGIASLERVPDGYVVEARVAFDGAHARYPLKFVRADGAWTLVWQPEPVYAAAFVAMVKHRSLVDVATATRWADTPRLPALPVIATRQRVVTPFGEAAMPEQGSSLLAALPELAHAAGAWTSTVLAGDLGPAGVDLLVDPALSWGQLNSVLFSVASGGLYQATVVTRDGGALLLASPVRHAPTIVAVYPLQGEWGVRLVFDDVPAPSSGCAPDMTVCIDAYAALNAHLPSEARGPLLLAAPSAPSVESVLQFVPVLHAHAKIAPHQLLLGYVSQ